MQCDLADRTEMVCAAPELGAALCNPARDHSHTAEAYWSQALTQTWRTVADLGAPIALCSLGGQLAMLRIVLGVSVLAALLVTYWVHPTTAWIVLGSSFTLAVAFKVRQRDEAEGALQATVDE